MAISLEDAKGAVKKHGSQRKAARALGIGQSTLSDLMRGKTKGGATRGAGGVPGAAGAPGGQGGRTLADFRRAHDKSYIVPNKIRAALSALGAGWEYELPFAKAAGVSLADLSAFRSMFEDHIVVVEKSKRAWAGTKGTAAKMREMVL